MITRSVFSYRIDNRLIAAHDALQKLSEVLSVSKISHPLVIASKGATQNGITEAVVRATGIPVDQVGLSQQIQSECTTNRVTRIASQFTAGHHDALIAVGGASVIDTAKAVRLLLTTGTEDVSAYCGIRQLEQSEISLIAIPTTIGIGSEASSSAIIRSSRSGRKLLFCSPTLIPNVTVIDPATTRSLQSMQLATGGLTSLALAIDSATALGTNPLSIELATRAMYLIFTWASRAVSMPIDSEARLQLAVASYLVGQSCSHSRAASVQAIANAICAVSSIQYTQAVSILSPYVIDYHLHKTEPILTQLFERIEKLELLHREQQLELGFKEEQEQITEKHVKSASMFIDTVNILTENLRHILQHTLPTRFYDILDSNGSKAVLPAQFAAIASIAQHDAAMFGAQEEMESQDIVRLLESSYWGYSLDKHTIRSGHQKTPSQEYQ